MLPACYLPIGSGLQQRVSGGRLAFTRTYVPYARFNLSLPRVRAVWASVLMEACGVLFEEGTSFLRWGNSQALHRLRFRQ